MKKVILSLVFVLVTGTSFMNANAVEIEELFSPECFEYADNWTSWKNNCIAFANDLAEFEYWEQMYNDCESVTNNDEFQFPN